MRWGLGADVGGQGHFLFVMEAMLSTTKQLEITLVLYSWRSSRQTHTFSCFSFITFSFSNLLFHCFLSFKMCFPNLSSYLTSSAEKNLWGCFRNNHFCLLVVDESMFVNDFEYIKKFHFEDHSQTNLILSWKVTFIWFMKW